MSGLSDDALASALKSPDGVARPQIRAVTVSGNRASLRLLLLSYPGGTREVALAQPITIPMRKRERRWVVDDLTLLIGSADSIYRQQERDRSG